MGFPIVCISHTDGSGCEQVGRDVAAKLNYRYVNEQIILEAARLAGVSPALVAQAEQRQSLVDRILDSMTSAQESLGAAALASGIAVPITSDVSYRHSDKDDLRELIRIAVLEVARGGRAVIFAHAASHALAGRPGVLRVLVTAPEVVRIRRVEGERKLSHDEADEAVRSGDAGRRHYLETFYNVEEESPTQYDLVINSEILTGAQAVKVIVAAANS